MTIVVYISYSDNVAYHATNQCVNFDFDDDAGAYDIISGEYLTPITKVSVIGLISAIHPESGFFVSCITPSAILI